MNLKALSFVAIAAAAFAAPTLAQTYRFLDYDMGQTVEMKGTVQHLDWMNPNSELRVLVKDGSTGKNEEWTFVMGPPTRSVQYGWSSDSLKAGDTVTVTIHPARDGSHSGQLVNAMLPDGRTLQATEPNPAG